MMEIYNIMIWQNNTSKTDAASFEIISFAIIRFIGHFFLHLYPEYHLYGINFTRGDSMNWTPTASWQRICAIERV